MTKAEAKKTLDSIILGQEALSGFGGNLESIFEIMKSSIGNESKVENQMGQLLCGDKKAFRFDIPETALPPNDDETSSYLPLEPPKSSCKLLEEKLSKSNEGKLIWKMLAPFLMGNVVYSPNDNFTNQIIAQVERNYK